MTRLQHTSEETQIFVKGRRKFWFKTGGWSVIVAIVTIIGFRDQLAEQLDWIINAIHGPTEVQAIKKQIWQLDGKISVVTNQLSRINLRVDEIDMKLSLPLSSARDTNSLAIVRIHN